MKNKTATYKVLLILSLSPILIWPLIFYGTLFLFDDPNANPHTQSILFYGINSYPIVLIVNTLISYKLCNKKEAVATWLTVWPILLFGAIIIRIFLA